MDTIKNEFAAVSFRPDQGVWDITFPNSGSGGFDGVRAWLDINGDRLETTGQKFARKPGVRGEFRDKLGAGEYLAADFELRESGLKATVEYRIYQGQPFLTVGLKLTNAGTQEAEIGRISQFCLRSKEKTCLDLSGSFDDWKIYIDSGNCNRAIVRPLNYRLLERNYEREMVNTAVQDWVEADNQHRSMGISAVFNPLTRQGMVLSFLTFLRARPEIRVEYSAKAVGLLAAESDFAGYRLKPGETLAAELLYIRPTNDPIVALEEYGRAVRDYNGISLKPAPIGWCSWYPTGFRDMVSEKKVLACARAIKKYFPGFGVRWIQVDYGWFNGNIPGEYAGCSERFPRGMEWLSGELRKLGFELGLWFSPSVITEYSGFFRKHPEALLSDRSGRPAPRHLGQWTWKPHGTTYDLDPTHPEARRFLKETFRRAVSKWRATYLKNDFLEQAGRSCAEHRNGRLVRGYETYRRLLRIIRDAAGEKTFIFGCSNLSNASLGLIDSNKAAPDIGAGREHARTFRPYGHFRTTFTTIAARWFQNNNFWINDPDVLIFEGSDLEQARMRTALVALSGGTMFLGDNLAGPGKKQAWVKLSKLCLPPYGKAGRPVDLFEKSYPEILDLPVERDFGRWHVTALFSFEEKGSEVTVDFAKLGLDPGRKYLVWNFWGEELAGVFSGRLKVRLAGVSSRLILIRPVPENPFILSTDMHVTQGAVEIETAAWDADKQQLDFACCRPIGEKGRVFVYCPLPYRLKSCSLDGKSAVCRRLSPGVLQVKVVFNRPKVRCRLIF